MIRWRRRPEARGRRRYSARDSAVVVRAGESARESGGGWGDQLGVGKKTKIVAALSVPACTVVVSTQGYDARKCVIIALRAGCRQ